MDEKVNNFYNTKKRNVDGQSCFALAAHRVILLHPDVLNYLLFAELTPENQPYSCAFKEFILAKDCSGIDKVVNVLLTSNGPQINPNDGGNH